MTSPSDNPGYSNQRLQTRGGSGPLPACNYEGSLEPHVHQNYGDLGTELVIRQGVEQQQAWKGLELQTLYLETELRMRQGAQWQKA